MIIDKNLTEEEQTLFAGVAAVCGLEITAPVSYRVDDSPSGEILAEIAERGCDALGTYNSVTGNVTLYNVRCAATASLFGANPRDVELIVLAHEWAHLVQHQGSHSGAPGHWKDFDRLPRNENTHAEDLAEKAAFMALHKRNDGRQLQRLMRKIAEKSPPDYSKWTKDYEAWLDDGIPPESENEWLQRLMREVRCGEKSDALAKDNFDE